MRLGTHTIAVRAPLAEARQATAAHLILNDVTIKREREEDTAQRVRGEEEEKRRGTRERRPCETFIRSIRSDSLQQIPIRRPAFLQWPPTAPWRASMLRISS